MSLTIILQFVVVLGAIWMGARYSGVGLGLWGAVGLLVLIVGFGVKMCIRDRTVPARIGSPRRPDSAVGLASLVMISMSIPFGGYG